MLPDFLSLAPPAPNVRLIGTPRIETGSLVTARFRSNRVLALLAYLCLRPGERVPRETLADRLWPALNSEAARNNLRVTLLYLRQILADHGLENGLDLGDRTAIGLDGAVVVSDLALYGSLIDRDPEGAACLAEGPLLSGLRDDWAEAARLEFVASRVRLGETLLRRDPRRALSLADAILSEDPLADRAVGLAARAHLVLGDSASAAGLLAAHRKRLREEVGSDLPPDLQALGEEAGTAVRPSRNSFPAPRTRFYGRQDELAAIKAWANDPIDRLMTVCGPGGIGKSRLGVEAAKGLGAIRTVLWIDATSAGTGESLLDLIVAEVSRGESVPGRAIDHLASALFEREIVLVLDNLEQIPDEGLAVVDELLARLPSARALCLSRKTLGLAGERILALGPLPLPQSSDDLAAPALALFLDRSPRRFADTSDLLRLSRDLEGIPLAIELAAARTAALGVRELLDGMSARLDLLVGRNSTHARHRTMRATLDWSFDLLEPVQRDAIASLAVLKNGWSLDAAIALGGDAAETRESVALACANSLLTHADSRYAMLECTREYALETLPPSAIERLRERQANHYLALADGSPSFAALEAEMPNLEAALGFFSERAARIESLLSLGERLVAFWTETSAGRTALRTLQTIDRNPLDVEARSRLELLEARVRFSISDFDGCLTACDAGLAVGGETARPGLLSVRCRACLVVGRLAEASAAADGAISASEGRSPAVVAESLLALGSFYIAELDARAFETVWKAVRSAETAGDPLLLSRALEGFAHIYFRRGEFDLAAAAIQRLEELPLDATAVRQAKRWLYRAQIDVSRGDLRDGCVAYEVALGFARASGHPWWLCQSLAQLGDTYTKLGRFDEACEAHREAYEFRIRTGEKRGLASCLRGLGMASYGLGRHEEAFLQLDEARMITEEANDEFLLATVLMPLARAALAAGRAPEAKRALEEALGVCGRIQKHEDLAQELGLGGMIEEARLLLRELHH